MRSTLLRSFALLFLVGAALAAQTAKADFHLSLIHVNDTHSKFEPSLTKLTLDIDDSLKAKPVYLELGGFPAVADTIGRLRATEANPLVIHAGDFYQGTLYFTKFAGEADLAFWNLVKLDAATIGNHEFDKGPQLLRDTLLTRASFPIVSANVDMTGEPLLKDVAPAAYKILNVGKSKVGVIGATTTETPFISSPGKNVKFNDPLASVQKAADALAKAGVNKIVLVSHLGYDVDIALAPKLAGVDLIVGGHSHTMLGDWKADGLNSLGAYPTVLKDKSGDTTLVVQAWEWGKVIGNLGVDFDAKGKIVASKAEPKLAAGSAFIQAYDLPDQAGTLSRVRWQWTGFALNATVFDGKDWKDAAKENQAYWAGLYGKVLAAIGKHPEIMLSAGDPAAWNLSRGYAMGVLDLQRTVVSQVSEDLKRGLNSGPGPIVADAMRVYTGSQVALTNAGGIRIDLMPGPLTTSKVYEVIPFGNTLVTMKATGAELVRTFEDGVDFGLSKYGDFPANPLTYVSGAQFSVTPANAKGSRVSEVKILQADGTWQPLDPAATYSLVVNNFMAAGGDKYDTLPTIANKKDTGYVDAEAFFAYVSGKTLSASDQRIKIIK